MTRRSNAAAEMAAAQASEAARVLQARGQESRNESEPEPARSEPKIPEGRIEQLRNNNPRNKIMDEIVSARGPKETEAKEEPEKPKEQPKEEPKVEAAPKPEVVEAPASAPAEVQKAAPVPKVVKVKVDGEEFEAPEEEVEAAGGVKSYQMQRAAENRLKKANEALAEARKSQSEVTQLATAILTQRHAATPQAPAETDEAFIAKRMDTLRFGTQDEAAKAQLEIIQRLHKPVDQNAIIEQATARVRHDQAVASFDKEFADIVTNPIRLKTVVALRQDRLERHRIEKPNQPIDWNSFYRTIGNEVRTAFGGSSQAASAPATTSGTPSPTSDKEARKASIVTLPASAAKAEAPKEEKPETREDVLNEMKRKRGQPVG